jgi:hypothetical protein
MRAVFMVPAQARKAELAIRAERKEQERLQAELIKVKQEGDSRIALAAVQHARRPTPSWKPSSSNWLRPTGWMMPARCCSTGS